MLGVLCVFGLLLVGSFQVIHAIINSHVTASTQGAAFISAKAMCKKIFSFFFFFLFFFFHSVTHVAQVCSNLLLLSLLKLGKQGEIHPFPRCLHGLRVWIALCLAPADHWLQNIPQQLEQ